MPNPVDIEFSSPFRSGYTEWNGGPDGGGHHGGDWQVNFGNDMNAPAGTPIYAAFDATIDWLGRRREKLHSTHIWGAQLRVRAAGGRVWGYYTHLWGVPPEWDHGTRIQRGQLLGHLSPNRENTPHLHFALAELVDGQVQGVRATRLLQSTANSMELHRVRFFGDGRQPVDLGAVDASSRLAGTNEPTTPRLADAELLRRAVGNRAFGAAARSPHAAAAAHGLRASPQAPPESQSAISSPISSPRSSCRK